MYEEKQNEKNQEAQYCSGVTDRFKKILCHPQRLFPYMEIYHYDTNCLLYPSNFHVFINPDENKSRNIFDAREFRTSKSLNQ